MHPSLFVYTTYHIIGNFILYQESYACRMGARPPRTTLTEPKASLYWLGSQTEGDSCPGRHQHDIRMAHEWPKLVCIGGVGYGRLYTCFTRRRRCGLVMAAWPPTVQARSCY